jgi:hypothetical protein
MLPARSVLPCEAENRRATFYCQYVDVRALPTSGRSGNTNPSLSVVARNVKTSIRHWSSRPPPDASRMGGFVRCPNSDKRLLGLTVVDVTDAR